MKAARLYNLLTRAMRPNDDDGALAFGDEDVTAAVASALLAYSRYHPALRRMGTGVLLDAANAGATTLNVLGGVFAVGQTLHLDTLGFAPEIVVVAGLAAQDRGGTDVLTIVQITLSTPLLFAHAPSALLLPAAPGLVLVPGVDTYALPSDWQGVDQDSFDFATGARQSPVREAGFYDGAYSQSAAMSGVGYGERTDFGGGFGQNTAQPVGMFGLPSAASGQTRYVFADDAPARLVVIPPPRQSRLLDFFYLGCHTIETVPEPDAEAFVAYATYSALSAQAAQVARLEDKMGGDERATYSKSREGLTAQAQACFDRFHRLLVNRPYAAGG